jgi:hypothetical protein
VEKLLNIRRDGGNDSNRSSQPPLASNGSLEGVMRSKMQVYGPDELKVLNQIVSAVLRETRSKTGLAGVPDVLLRERIGKQVLKRAADDLLNVNGIRRAVLASLKKEARPHIQ